MIRGLKFASIPVSDQERSLAFYTRQLGFAIATDQPFGDGRRWIELKIPGAETRVVLFTPDGHEDRIGTFQGLSFWTDDVKQTYEALSARGVQFQGPVQTEHWGSSAIFLDPDGNSFVLSSR
ncbi:MAG: VOC family protein [Gemmatimonadaceae bacterium]